METMESLLAQNFNFNRTYGIKSSDLELCNYLASVIEETRCCKEPIPGDIIQCCGPKKEYLFGHMDLPVERDWGGQICVRPSISFVYVGYEYMPKFSTSGGYWISCGEAEMFVYKGTAVKTFCTFGSAGWCGGGAIKFEAKVNVWNLFLESIY